MSSFMLVEMREITSVSPSPDGALVVIEVSHSNPSTNEWELSWVILSRRGDEATISVPAGEVIFDPEAAGAPLNVQARWSPDGKWFFYPRRQGREVQLWETSRDGAVTRQVTNLPSDVIGVSAASDPNDLVLKLAPERETLRRAEQDENWDGILYDDHVLGGFPLTKTFPSIDRWRSIRSTDNGEWRPPGWNGTITAVFNMRRGELTTGGPKNPIPPTPSMDSCRANCTDSHAYRATVVALGDFSAARPHEYAGQYTVQLEPKTPRGKSSKAAMKCDIADCRANQITILGWSPDESEIYYLADPLLGRLGALLPGHTAIYGWNPKRNIVRKIHDSQDRLYNLASSWGPTLTDARVVKQEIVVVAAGVDEPPRLQAINLASGATRTLFDPNAELRRLTNGRAVWHTWPTSSGYPGRGVVVLPDEYRVGTRYPLIITSYSCGGGLLRGGGSDNAPEFVAARHGFVAICVDIPLWEIIAREPDTSRMYPIACSIVAELIADQDKAGIIDRSRVGLSGHSFGADFGSYCLGHSLGKDPSHGIAAAAFRSGSVLERAQWDLFDTAAWRRDPVNGIYARLHLPDPRHDPAGRWQDISVANKAAQINTPLLIQAGDTDYVKSLSLWSAMRDEGKAVEMHVFPEEPHRLIQPAHQLMNFERQIDWFRFWLKSEEDDVPSKRGQYGRWRGLREASRAAVQSR
jgi:dipeptidyl aminopeptidase/acylaminoacyl peptidase